MSIELSLLPEPDVAEPLDFETLVTKIKEDVVARNIDLAGVIELESEPIVMLIEAFAYRELLLRSRINDAARANLLAFASGTDLDHLGAFYEVTRIDGETDDRLRLRIQIKIAALAGNGTAESYIYKALTVSLSVVSAAVLTPSIGAVEIAVWITAGSDATAVLRSVENALNSDDAKILCVPVTVRMARARPINITATLHREASAPVDIAARQQAAVALAISSYARLGRDISLSWLNAKLHVDGVSRIAITAPLTNITLQPDEYATPGIISITDGGAAW